MTGKAPSDEVAPLFGRLPDQYGFLVEDLSTAVRFQRDTLGLGPWSIYDYNAQTVPQRTYLGRPGTWSTRSAVLDGASYSLVQPVDGESTYSTMLATRGPGLHHVAYRVTDMGGWRSRMAAHGFAEVMSGAGHGIDLDGEFVFFGSAELPGCFIELIEPPMRRRDPVEIIR